MKKRRKNNILTMAETLGTVYTCSFKGLKITQSLRFIMIDKRREILEIEWLVFLRKKIIY